MEIWVYTTVHEVTDWDIRTLLVGRILLLFHFLFHTTITYKYPLKASSVSDSLDL